MATYKIFILIRATFCMRLSCELDTFLVKIESLLFAWEGDIATHCLWGSWKGSMSHTCFLLANLFSPLVPRKAMELQDPSSWYLWWVLHVTGFPIQRLNHGPWTHKQRNKHTRTPYTLQWALLRLTPKHNMYLEHKEILVVNNLFEASIKPLKDLASIFRNFAMFIYKI